MQNVFRNLTIVLVTSGAIKSWQPGEVISTNDLNANFSHIHSKMVGGHGARLVDSDVSASASISTSKLAGKFYMVKAWGGSVNNGSGSACTAGTCSMNASEGVSVVTHIATGKYTVTLSPSMTDNNYAAYAVFSDSTLASVDDKFCFAADISSTNFRVWCYDVSAAGAADAEFAFLVLDNN